MNVWKSLIWRFAKHRPAVQQDFHDFSKLKNSEHMLLRIYEKPYEAIVEEAEKLLSTKFPHCKISKFIVTSDPDWLTSLRPENSEGMSQISRIAVAFEFDLFAKYDGTDPLHMKGVFTWIIANLGLESRRYQFCIDPNGQLAEFGNKGEMLSRLYAL